MSWSIADIPRQDGRVAVVTGGNSGLGFVTARELGAAGAHVVIACRDATRGADALEALRQLEPAASFGLVPLDLSSLGSVAEAAAVLEAELDRVDILVNNAGVMVPPYRLSEDGFELQIATNHLGHFALTARLSHLLGASPLPRVVTVSSAVHRSGSINFQDLHSEKRYRRYDAYAQSKLANLLFTYELQRRAGDAGWAMLSLASHPGYASTNLQSSGIGLDGQPLLLKFTALANAIFAQDAEGGALPTLYAATSRDVPPGAFVGPDGPFEMRGAPRLVEPSAAARDEIAARRLWELSEELTGVAFEMPVGQTVAV